MVNSLVTVPRDKYLPTFIYTCTDCCQKSRRTSIYTEETFLCPINLSCIFLCFFQNSFRMMKIVKS